MTIHTFTDGLQNYCGMCQGFRAEISPTPKTPYAWGECGEYESTHCSHIISENHRSCPEFKHIDEEETCTP